MYFEVPKLTPDKEVAIQAYMEMFRQIKRYNSGEAQIKTDADTKQLLCSYGLTEDDFDKSYFRRTDKRKLCNEFGVDEYYSDKDLKNILNGGITIKGYDTNRNAIDEFVGRDGGHYIVDICDSEGILIRRLYGLTVKKRMLHLLAMVISGDIGNGDNICTL